MKFKIAEELFVIVKLEVSVMGRVEASSIMD